MTEQSGQVPLKIPLPSPPFVTIAGEAHILEYVAIDRLDAWRQEHGLVFERIAFLGEPKWRPTHDGKMQFSGLGHVLVHRCQAGTVDKCPKKRRLGG